MPDSNGAGHVLDDYYHNYCIDSLVCAHIRRNKHIVACPQGCIAVSDTPISWMTVSMVIFLIVLIAFVVLIKDSLFDPAKKVGAEFQYCKENSMTLGEFDSFLANSWMKKDWRTILSVYTDYKNCFNAKSSSVAFYAFKNAASHCSEYLDLSSECQKIQGDLV